MDNLKQFNTMASEDNWRTQSFRQSVVSKIEEVIQCSGVQVGRNSSEMENHVFMKTKTREEYMSMLAKLILYLREMCVGMGMVASPLSSLNTPMGASVASPGGEEAAYREKVRQLSKKPLRRMVHRMVSEGEREYIRSSRNPFAGIDEEKVNST